MKKKEKLCKCKKSFGWKNYICNKCGLPIYSKEFIDGLELGKSGCYPKENFYVKALNDEMKEYWEKK